jgi:transaldolase
LIFKASDDLNIDPIASYCVGDRWRDIEAGLRAGCTTLFMDLGYAEADVEPHKRVTSLVEATDWIIDRMEKRAVAASHDLRIKIFADGADLESIKKTAEDPTIKGFTTNPTLMHKAGVTDYEAFAKEVLACVSPLPVSFEVFSDEWAEMERQARLLASWGANVYVKIPVTNTKGESAAPLIKALASDGTQLNVTALMTVPQVERVADAMSEAERGIVSVFAGRIADSGVDPIPVMCDALKALASTPQLELLWASPREVLNIVQADHIGCHIITATYDLLAKLNGVGKDLNQFSLETVQMFHKDAVAAGFSL